MPYVTHASGSHGGGGAASDMVDFARNKLATFMTSTSLFASGDHWTRSQADVSTGGGQYDLFLTPPANLTVDVDSPGYLALHAKPTGLFMFPASGFDGARPSYDQPGGPGCYPPVSSGAPEWVDTPSSSTRCPYVGLNLPSGWQQHHLFAPPDGRYCYAVIQIAARRYRHLWIGNFTKFGGNQAAFDGGEFVCGHEVSTSNTYIDNPYLVSAANGGPITNPNPGMPMRSGVLFRAADLQAGASNSWFSVSESAALSADGGTRPSGASYSNVNQTAGAKTVGRGGMSGCGPSGFGAAIFICGPSLLSNLRALQPVYLGICSQIDSAVRVCPIGQVPDVFRINMNGLTPGQTITIGAFDYVVFPLINSDQVNTLPNEEYSGFEGYAYRVHA